MAGHHESRKSVRFPADLTTAAFVDTTGNAQFQANAFALVLNESYRGCGIVVIDRDEYRIGAIIRVKVGKLEPIRAEIRWRVTLDPRVIRMGLQYLD